MNKNLNDEEIILENEEIISDSEEIIEDLNKFDPTDIVVYSRDWTIETIYTQIKGGNINLNPKYQRRNAWNDHKRSKLIESILIGYPVPEIVLAEDPKQKKSFSVIDGKQRLLTIAGFISPRDFNYWDKPLLKDLLIKENLSGVNYEELENSQKYSNEYRQFNNASLRCTIITNYKENDILYDIFYRLNSGSTPLATQELRQVLNRGEFANYLILITNELQPLHKIMNLSGPDKRLRDIEILLRCISMILFGETYTGNLKQFLDTSMSFITNHWSTHEEIISKLYNDFNSSIEKLKFFFDQYSHIGRKITEGRFESRFNRVLLEVQIFYFLNLNDSFIKEKYKTLFLKNFKDLCQDDIEFRKSIETSTKNINNYKSRYSKFEDLINKTFSCNLKINPFH